MWLGRVLGVVKEDGGGLVGDGEGFAGGEGTKGGTGAAKRAAVVGMCDGQVVARTDGLFHETAALLAAPDSVFVVEFGSCTAHSLNICAENGDDDGGGGGKE